MTLRKPRPLRPGDTIGIVSPSSPITSEVLERGLQLFRDRGYKIKLFPHVLEHKGFLAGNDAVRAADLMSAFLDPEVDGIWCSRGGYGSARLFPFLDFDAMAATGKLFAGFSDITSLHLALNHAGLATIHAPMIMTLAYDRIPEVYESVWSLVEGKPTWPTHQFTPTTVKPGVATGVITGGCMILMCDSIGTQYPIDAKGKLLFIEDVDENPHRVDAMLTHLKNAGVFDHAAGILIGEMTRTDEKADEAIGAAPWREIVKERLADVDCPIVMDVPIGHHKDMLSFAMGVKARMDASTGRVEYLENPTCE